MAREKPADGESVVINTVADGPVLESFAFENVSAHTSAFFGFGTEHEALTYLNRLNTHGHHFVMRRPTIEEAANLERRRSGEPFRVSVPASERDVFLLADELKKFNPIR
jgi:hypothetical protein